MSPNTPLPLFLLALVGFFSLTASQDVKVLADETIELASGDSISSELFSKLQAAHGYAVNQKEKEDLFINLPLVAPNATDSSVSVANSSATISARGVEKRALDCGGPILYPGYDPCYGLENVVGFVPCDKPCKFTLNYFVDNMVAPPGINECLFYTSGLSEVANAYAARHNSQNRNSKLTTIWWIWDYDGVGRRLFRWDKQIDNPMRCIIQENVVKGSTNPIRQNYFGAMSDAMAYLCGGRAAVMDRNIKIGGSGRVKQASIWQHREFPRLKMGAADKWVDPQGNWRVVNAVDALGMQDPNDEKTQIWWRNWWRRDANGEHWGDWPIEWGPNGPSSRKRDGNLMEDEDPLAERSIEKRASTSIFDEGGELAVDW